MAKTTPKPLDALELRQQILSKFRGGKYTGGNYKCAQNGRLICPWPNEGEVFIDKMDDEEIEIERYPLERFINVSPGMTFVAYEGKLPRPPGIAGDEITRREMAGEEVEQDEMPPK